MLPISVIWDFVGIKGLIAIALSIALGLCWLNSKSLENDIKNLQSDLGKVKVQLAIANAAIEEQNKSIEKAGKDLTDAQAALDKANKDNKSKSAELEDAKKKLKDRPLAKNCLEAIAEIKTETSKQVKGWNK